MKRIFDKTTCWDIFDQLLDPEPYWALQRAGLYEAARRAAIRLTLLHPIKMIPVIIACAHCS
jgi:hypothetical protein